MHEGGDASKSARWTRRALWGLLAAAALAPWLGRAAPVALTTFSNGTVANAGDVNANFNALSSALAARARWTPLDKVSLGAFPESTASLTYTLPPQVPSDATEVLVYAQFITGNVPTNTAREFRFYTQDEVDAAKKYSHYMYIYGYPQSAVAYTSDNFWVPVTAERKLYAVRTTGPAFTDNYGGSVYVIGYR